MPGLLLRGTELDEKQRKVIQDRKDTGNFSEKGLNRILSDVGPVLEGNDGGRNDEARSQSKVFRRRILPGDSGK